MSQALELAKHQLLDPVGLDIGDIQNTLDKLMAHDIDAADLYFEASRAESWVMEDSIIREASKYKGASIITVPSAFTYSTGKRHWQMLLSARAVENLCFVIASNQGGQNTEKRTTWGHSMIIDPWGNILCELEQGPGVACADLDLARVEELRTSFPALDHRILGI